MLSLNLVELIQSFTGAYLPHKGRDLAPVSVGKVVVDVSSTAKGLLQQNLLRFVRIYSNFKRLFHVNHFFSVLAFISFLMIIVKP